MNICLKKMVRVITRKSLKLVKYFPNKYVLTTLSFRTHLSVFHVLEVILFIYRSVSHNFLIGLGFETYFDNVHGFTYFGQAFTHAIAQYACDQSLNEIMNRVII